MGLILKKKRIRGSRKKRLATNAALRNKKPRYGGKCNNIYSANGGSGSDVTKWRRLYGGSRQLFNTKSCKYACDQKITGAGLLKF